nr:MAG TPA: hypothetical protein [Caudoviricetes sp.]
MGLVFFSTSKTGAWGWSTPLQTITILQSS